MGLEELKHLFFKVYIMMHTKMNDFKMPYLFRYKYGVLSTRIDGLTAVDSTVILFKEEI